MSTVLPELGANRPVRPGVAPPGATLCAATGKWGYPDRDGAEAALERLHDALRGRRDHISRKSYHCAFCAAWHLSSGAEEAA
jgi:hypothetical protein